MKCPGDKSATGLIVELHRPKEEFGGQHARDRLFEELFMREDARSKEVIDCK